MLDVQGLHIRAALFRSIREFFTKQGFLEVDTPVRQPVLIPEANIIPIEADGQFLQTSPELFMKRLLARGCGNIFQICPCFRKGELGSKHLEEFTMLEWYRTDADYNKLMDDCEALLSSVVPEVKTEIMVQGRGDTDCLAESVFLSSPEKITVADAFAKFSPVPLSRALADDLFDEILVEHIEPRLGVGKPQFLYDYPVQLASLAKVKTENPCVAERFELYIDGIELANGFSELTDEREQRQRFHDEIELIGKNQSRQAEMPAKFLSDLKQLDTVAGIAFGIDRLLMLLIGKQEIGEAVSFTAWE